MTLVRLRQWAKGSLWLVPVALGLAGVGLGIGLVELDRATPGDEFAFSSATATQLLAAVVGAAVAFTGFALSVLLLVVQLASSQLAARDAGRRPGMAEQDLARALVGTLTSTLVLLESVTGSFVPRCRWASPGSWCW